jgi:hypothetical protein
MDESTPLRKELNKRGSAELSPTGKVTQVTQALDETPTKVKFLIFGELKEQNIMTIEQACAKCVRCYYPTTKECQAKQKQDAMARGFNNMVCPQQFID